MSDLNLKRNGIFKNSFAVFRFILFFSVMESLRTAAVKFSGLCLGGQMELNSRPMHLGHSLTLTPRGPFPCVLPQIISFHLIFLQDYCLGPTVVA